MQHRHDGTAGSRDVDANRTPHSASLARLRAELAARRGEARKERERNTAARAALVAAVRDARERLAAATETLDWSRRLGRDA